MASLSLYETELRYDVLMHMILQITNDLTIGGDNDLLPYSQERISEYIKDHRHEIHDVVNDMFNEYKNDDELEDLEHAELDWYREFLYEHIPYDSLMQ